MTIIETYNETVAKNYFKTCKCVRFTRIKGKYTLFLK